MSINPVAYGASAIARAPVSATTSAAAARRRESERAVNATLPIEGPHTVTFGSSRTLLDGGTRKLNDVTTTKQHFDSGYNNYLAILASEYEFTDDDGSYWHYTQCINASCP